VYFKGRVISSLPAAAILNYNVTAGYILIIDDFSNEKAQDNTLLNDGAL